VAETVVEPKLASTVSAHLWLFFLPKKYIISLIPVPFAVSPIIGRAQKILKIFGGTCLKPVIWSPNGDDKD